MSDIGYTKEHCWCRVDGGEVVVGITDYAQEQMSELTFVELPEVGDHVEASSEMAVVESVKAANDVYAPIGGEIVAVNEALQERPELVNQDPFGKGWICRIKPDCMEDVQELLDADSYEAGLPDE